MWEPTDTDYVNWNEHNDHADGLAEELAAEQAEEELAEEDYRRGVGEANRNLVAAMDSIEKLDGLTAEERWAMLRQIMATAVGR